MRRYSSFQTFVLAACGAAAVLFFVLALHQPEKEPPGWIDVSEAAAASVAALEETGAEAAQQAAGQGAATETSGAAAEQGSGTPGGEATGPAGAEAAGDVAAGKVSGGATPDGKLDVNTATAEQLDALKGIGPSKAAAIVADREANGPFRSVDDLLRVKGIGEKLLAGIKDSVTALP
ncbi:ComEA family DNA-binding protein [Paenibacillus thailandensis]|uniref:ComEA family DNA-binding protein n=1 Tax=Paenibacillus thailandensis TaxID=393250 RepID=A0ABW5QZW5_9BACL